MIGDGLDWKEGHRRCDLGREETVRRYSDEVTKEGERDLHG